MKPVVKNKSREMANPSSPKVKAVIFEKSDPKVQSDLSGIDNYLARIKRKRVRYEFYFAEFLLFSLAFWAIVQGTGLFAHSAIPARIPVQTPPEAVKSDKTMLSIMVMLSFLVIETICNTKFMRKLVLAAHTWLENRNRNSKLYQAYSEAKSALSEPHCETAQLDPPQEGVKETVEAQSEPPVDRMVLFYVFVLYLWGHVRDMITDWKTTCKFLAPCLAFKYSFPEFVTLPMSALLVMVFLLGSAARDCQTSVADEAVVGVCVEVGDETPSPMERADRIVRYYDAAVEFGKKKAEMEEDDCSYATTSTKSTMSSYSLEAIPVPNEDSVHDALAELFGGSQKFQPYISLLTLFFTAPKYADSPILCTAHHVSNFSNFWVYLVNQYPQVSKQLLVIMRRAFKEVGAVFGLESKDQDESNQWVHNIATGLDKLSRFETSIVGKTFGATLSLICTLPIILTDLYNSESYLKAWKTCMKSFKFGGASLSVVLRNILTIYRTCIGCKLTGNPRSVLAELMESDDLVTEYYRCHSLLSQIESGTKTLKVGDTMAVTERFARLATRMAARLNESSSQAEIKRAMDCEAMRRKIVKWFAAAGHKPYPFTLSFDGLPGCGKSLFCKSLDSLMHKWAGIEDIMSTSEISITQEWDNQSTSATTSITLDDQGNIKPEFRKTPLSAIALKLGQSKPVEIPKPALEEKGEHFYNNRFLIYIDNSWERGLPDELIAPMAGLRRLGICTTVKVKPEYDNGSGQVCPIKAAGTSSFGEVQLFKPYRIIKKGNNAPEHERYFKEEWIDWKIYLPWLKAQQTAHFEREKWRMLKVSKAEESSLCTGCLLLPYSDCFCATEMFDAKGDNEDEGSESDSDESDSDSETETAPLQNEAIPLQIVDRTPICQPVQAPPMVELEKKEKIVITPDMHQSLYEYYERGIQTGYSLAHSQIESWVLRAVTFLRIETLQRSWTAKVLDNLFQSKIHKILPCLVFIWGLWSTVSDISCQSVFILFVAWGLIGLGSYFDHYWNLLARADMRMLVDIHVSNLMRYGSYLAVGVGIMGLVSQVPSVWKMLVESIPMSEPTMECAELESAPKPASVEKEELKQNSEKENSEPELKIVQKPRKAASDPIWRQPRRVQIQASEKALTITQNDLNRIATGNLLQCTFELPGGIRRKQYLLMLNDAIGVTTAHVAVQNGAIHRFKIIPEPKHEKCIIDVQRDQVHIPDQSDLMFLYIQGSFGHFKDLTPYLPEDKKEGKIIMTKMVENPTGFDRENVEGIYEEVEVQFPDDYGEKRDIQSGYYVCIGNRLMTGKGQCGLFYTSVGKVSTIIAIHGAGDAHYTSYAIPLSTKIYRASIDSFIKRGFQEPLKKRPRVLKVGKPITQAEDDPKHPVSHLGDGENRIVEVTGYRRMPFSPRSEVQYCPYLTQGIRYMGLKPTKVRPRMRWKFSVWKVLNSATKNLPQGHIGSLRYAKSQLRQLIKEGTERFRKKYPDAEWTKRPLTLKEVLNGIEDSPFNCLDLSRSSGIGGKKGNYVLIRPDGQRILDPDLVAEVLELLRDIAEGYDPCFETAACLKDELVKLLAEVDSNKQYTKLCRLFYNPQFHLYLLSAMYFKHSLEVITESSVLFSTAIGMNPVGEEADEVIRMFAEEGFIGNAIDGDYETMDSTQQPMIRGFATNFLCDINEELGWSEEDVDIARKIGAVMDSTPINMCGAVVRTRNLLASGYIFTAHRNGLITLLLAAYDYFRFWKSKGELREIDSFRRDIRLITLGDDLILAAHHSLLNAGWSFDSFRQSAGEWGFSITTANKDLNFVFKDFYECEFLKRYYNYHPELGMNVLCAHPKSYLQPFIANIRGKDWEENEYYSDMCDNALLEAFFGGRESFEEIKERLIRFYAAVPLADPHSLNWSFEDLVESHGGFHNQKQHFPVTDMGKRLLDEYDSIEISPLIWEPAVDFPKDVFHDAVMESETVPTDNTEEVGIQELEGLVQDIEMNDHDNQFSRLPLTQKTEVHKMLERRMLLQTIDSWPTTPIKISAFSDMLSQEVIADRLKNVAFFSADVELTIEVIAPSTVAGLAMVSIIHYPDTAALFSVSAQDVCSLSQRDHILIRVGAVETISKIVVPYFFQESAINPSADSLAILLPGVMITPLSPLISATGTAASMQMKVYGNFRNIVAYGATSVRNPGLAFMETGGDTDEEEEESSSEESVCTELEFDQVASIWERVLETAWKPPDFLFDASKPRCHIQRCPVLCAYLRCLGKGGQCFVKKSRREQYEARHRCWVSCLGTSFGYEAVPTLCFWEMYGGTYDDVDRKITVPSVCIVVLGQHMKFSQHVKEVLKLQFHEVFACGEVVTPNVNVSISLADLLLAWKESMPRNHPVHTVSVEGVFPQILPNPAPVQLETESISNTMKRISDVGKQAAKIPGLGNLAVPSEVIGQAGKLVAMMGFSKPIERAQAPNPTNFMANGIGRDHADVIAVHPGNEVALHPPGYEEDEMDFNHIQRRWSVIGRFELSPSSGFGEEILGLNVTPSIVIGGQPAACAAASLFTQYWRGSMEYRVIAVVPTLVSVKLAIMYDPLGPNHTDSLGAVPVIQEDFVDHVILDTATNQTADIVVGYAVPNPALSTMPHSSPKTAAQAHINSNHVDSKDAVTLLADLNDHWYQATKFRQGYHNGRLMIRVHDRVRGGSGGTPPNIPIIVMARCGEDMQFAGYNGTLPGIISVEPNESLSSETVPFIADTCATAAGPTQAVCETALVATTPPNPVPTVAPTPASTTTAPTTLSPTTAQPTSAAPVTEVPTASVPTSMAPTVMPPVTSAPTSADICGGTPLWSPGLMGSNISPNTDYVLASHIDNEIVFTGSTSYDMWSGAYCNFYEIEYTVSSGTAYASSNVTTDMPMDAPSGSIVMTFDPVPLGQNAPYNVNTSITTADPNQVITITNARSFGTPAGVRMHSTTVATNNGSRWAAPNAVPYVYGTTGYTLNPTIETRTKEGFSGYYVPGSALVHFGADASQLIDEDQTFCTIVAYGYLRVKKLNGSVTLETTKNSWRQHTFKTDREGCLVETPETNSNYPVSCVRYISFFTKMTDAEAASNINNLVGPQTFGARRTLLSKIMMETEVEEAKNTGGLTHYLGGPRDSSEFFNRIVAGENLSTFRTLLKIPTPVRQHITPNDPSFDGLSVTKMYSDGGSASLRSLYWFLHSAFCGVRGSMVYHYMVIGDGYIEVSRRFNPDSTPFLTQSSGIAATDSRVNPHLEVRFQNQSPYLYTVAAGFSADPEAEKVLRIYSWGNVVRVRVLRSTGEDFSFTQFRGLPRITEASFAP